MYFQLSASTQMCHVKEWMELGFLYPLGKNETEGEKKNLLSEKNIVHIITTQFVI